VELPHPVELVVVRWLALWPPCWRPAGSAHGADGQGPELVERERAVRVVLEDVLDPVQLGVAVGVVGLLPGLGPLERDVVGDQQLTEPFPPDRDHPDLVLRQEVHELADAPAGEGLPELLRAGGGRLDDEALVVSRDLAGTATRPLRVQGSHPHLVEPVDHLPDPVLGGRRELSDHRHRVPTGRGMHHQRSPPLDMGLVGLAAPTPHDPLELLAFLGRQPPHSKWFRHAPIKTGPGTQVVDAATHEGSWSGH
jgi:hypothetical protein